MPTDLLTLVAKRDYTKIASGGSIVHYLLRPMSFELKSGQAIILRRRQDLMRKLMEREHVEFERLKMIKQI